MGSENLTGSPLSNILEQNQKESKMDAGQIVAIVLVIIVIGRLIWMGLATFGYVASGDYDVDKRLNSL
jgi:hypothetical protein